MFWLIIAIALTLLLSFSGTLLATLLIHVTEDEVEELKQTHPVGGAWLETQTQQRDGATDDLLAFRSAVTVLGCLVIGGLFIHHFGSPLLGLLAFALTLALLILTEALPRNLARARRHSLLPHAILPLRWVRSLFTPLNRLGDLMIRWVVPSNQTENPANKDSATPASREKHPADDNEASIIANALTLDDVRVSEIMTPRTVVTALRRSATISEIFKEFPTLPFGRMPVYGRNLDEVVGLVRRRDLHNAKAHDRHDTLVEQLMQEIHFVPETITVGSALQTFLKKHQKLLLVVDEFGSTAGVVTMEDVIEHLLGREIFEKDDPAIDMRELARTRLRDKNRANEASTPFPPPRA